MFDVIEFYTFEEGVKAFKNLEAKGDCKVVAIDRDGVKEYKGKKLYYISVELYFED